MIITIDHIRAYGYCAKGARAFFKQYQLSWVDFLQYGIPAETLLATDNAIAIELVNKVQELQHGNE